jgi:hypothetical protein
MKSNVVAPNQTSDNHQHFNTQRVAAAQDIHHILINILSPKQDRQRHPCIAVLNFVSTFPIR